MPETPKPILLPLDGSRGAENAVPMAAMLADHHGVAVRMVQVVDESLDPPARLRAREIFEEYARDLAAAHGIAEDNCEAESIVGEPAEVIISLAGVSTAVTIGSHGRGGFQALVLGSVADRVVRGTPVPVLVVPAIGSPPPRPRRILVPLDGSPEAERALPIARALAGHVGAAVTLVQGFVEVLPPAPEMATYGPDFIDELRKGAEEYLARLAESGEKVIVRYGRPSTAIIQVAHEIDADLVVMTSSGKGLGRRLLLGSTTDRVLHTLHRPIYVIPPERA